MTVIWSTCNHVTVGRSSRSQVMLNLATCHNMPTHSKPSNFEDQLLLIRKNVSIFSKNIYQKHNKIQNCK